MISSTDQTMYRLDNLNAEQVRINYQLSTGKKLQYGSDDSNVFTREVYINDKISLYEGIKSQIQKASAQNNGSDSTLSEAKKLLAYVKTEVLKGLTDTTDDSARSVIAENLRGVKENLLDLANEQIEGEYLFSGSDSSVKPFIMNETTGKVSYVGDNELRKIAVEEGSYRDRGVNGQEAFFSITNIGYSSDILTFSRDSHIRDQNGNIWERHKLVPPGGSLTFVGGTIVDGNEKVWTFNASISRLEDGEGGTIPVSTFGSFHTISSIPSSTNGMAYNQLRRYDENGNLVPNEFLDISGVYPNDLSVTLPSDNETEFTARKSIFDVVDNIINALDKVDADGNALSDSQAKTALQDGLDNITNAYESMNAAHAKLGGRNKVFEISLESVNAKVFQYEKLQQEVSGVDLAEVAVEAKALELTYTSLYSTINRTNELSLVNFLR